jgi:hypothetical protein
VYRYNVRFEVIFPFEFAVTDCALVSGRFSAILRHVRGEAMLVFVPFATFWAR